MPHEPEAYNATSNMIAKLMRRKRAHYTSYLRSLKPGPVIKALLLIIKGRPASDTSQSDLI